VSEYYDDKENPFNQSRCDWTNRTDILVRLQQELSAARSRNAAEEIFYTAERSLSEDDLDSFTAYYADILLELPE
jgi:hypothetical protein